MTSKLKSLHYSDYLSLSVRSLEIRFVKMVSSAYNVIFSFSHADNSFAEKGFTRILLPRFITLLAV